MRTDVSVETDVKAMIDHAVDGFGRLDCLMNNAERSSQFAAIAVVDLEQFDAVVAVNLRAVLAGMKICGAGYGGAGNGQHHQRRECQRNPRRTGRTPLFSREGSLDSPDTLRSNGTG